MATPLLSIIIVTRNRHGELRRCLRSLAQLSYPNRETVIVDNASDDGLTASVAAEFSGVRLFSAARNYGCGIGRNIGARIASGDYLWFVDDDAEVVVADAGERLIAKLAAEPDVGGIGGEAVIDVDGRIVGVKQLDLLANGMTSGRITSGIEDDAWLDADLLAGCNVIVRRAEFIAMGGFDPTYRHGWEDTDFGRRLTRRGKQLLIAGFAPVLHHFSGAERQTSLRVPAQSRAYFLAKNAPWLALLTMPILDLAYLLNPWRWARVLDKAKRIDFGAKGRIVRADSGHQKIEPRQFRAALRVGLNYAATVGGSYVFGWSMIAKGLAARRRMPDGFRAADALVGDHDHSFEHGPLAAAE